MVRWGSGGTLLQNCHSIALLCVCVCSCRPPCCKLATNLRCLMKPSQNRQNASRCVCVHHVRMPVRLSVVGRSGIVRIVSLTPAACSLGCCLSYARGFEDMLCASFCLQQLKNKTRPLQEKLVQYAGLPPVSTASMAWRTAHCEKQFSY